MIERFNIGVRQMAEPQKEKEAKVLEIERRFREMWVHEDNLINQRLTWYTSTQSLLVAGYGLTFQASDKNPIWESFGEQARVFVKFLPWLGLALSVIVFLGLIAAAVAMRYIQVRKNAAIIAAGAEVDPHSRFGVTRVTTLLGLLAGLGIPFAFGLMWLAVALYR